MIDTRDALPALTASGIAPLAQANAYDAYKRHMIKRADMAAYHAERDLAAASPAMTGTGVPAILAIRLAG